jgi:hypothetical protein
MHPSSRPVAAAQPRESGSARAGRYLDHLFLAQLRVLEPGAGAGLASPEDRIGTIKPASGM